MDKAAERSLHGDLHHFPTPPQVGRGLRASDWLRQIADINEKKGATARAREARELASWLSRLARWLRREGYEPAPAQGMSARQGENSRSEVEGEARQPGPAKQDAPNDQNPFPRPHEDNPQPPELVMDSSDRGAR